MPNFPTSLRSRAIFLVLLAILPLLVLTLYSYFHQRERAIREVQRDELTTARHLATVQATLINTTRQLLASLALLPAVQQRDEAVCRRLFADMLGQSPYYTIIAAADSEGRLFASAPAASVPINVADRFYFKRVLQTRGFVIGEPVLGRITKRYCLDMGYPVLDDQGQVKGVLAAGIDLDWLGSLLAQNDFPANTAAGLVDATGNVLFRYPEPQKYSGKMLPEAVIQTMRSQDEGVAEGVGLPGDERLFAFVRLAPPWDNMRLAIGLPKARALEQVNRDLRRNLIWLAAAALLAGTAARFAGNSFILGPVAKLLEVTQRLTHGDLAARTGVRDQAGELNQLAQAFDQMADSLQERDADLKKTAAELAERVEELHRRSQELAEANKELENFTYSVAHDLRAPLRAIGGFARVLLEDYPDKLDANAQRYLNIIQSDARKMGRLIDDLLSLARLGRKEMRFVELDMTALVQEVTQEVQAAHPERNLHFEIQPLPVARADPAMIRLVLENLLLNAIKFTRDRDTALIQVKGWRDEDAHDNVYCLMDNGVGFDMRYANKLFGVFQRLHSEVDFEGTGVGLAKVKRIIDRHGGKIWAESVVNEGAALYFTIPC